MDSFALLDDASPGALARLYTGHRKTLVCNKIEEWPALLKATEQCFAEGLHAIPVLSYELGAHLQNLPAKQLAGPIAQIHLYAACQLMNALEVDAWLDQQADGPAGITQVHANVDEAQFTEAIAKIHAYIEAGDTYQVNYTYRLRFEAYGSAISLYRRLRQRQPVPYGALIQQADGSAIVSLSPELFMRCSAGELLARPMKGTAPAADEEADNAQRCASLAADPKNRAENLMIVDLLRNDLGRVAETGSVAVPALFEVSRFGSVLQMTSTVTARLRQGAGLADIFAALYPCGSITGAPKRRTMEIIHELEPDARGVYTGAIGWMAPDGDFCFSVPIRTLALQAPQNGVRQGEMGVGAGIVFDSEAQDEFQECRLKARFLTGLQDEFDLFETMRGEHGAIALLERHLARLARSATHFQRPFDVDAARSLALQAAASGGLLRIRLALGPSGNLSVQTAPLAAIEEPVALILAEQATRADDLFARHKTSFRPHYDAAWKAAEAQGAFDALFFNQHGELTEGGRSNVFLRLDGQWYTPPLSSGILPGVMRAVLLEDPVLQAQERILTRADLGRAESIMVCNALRGALTVRPMPKQ